MTTNEKMVDAAYGKAALNGESNVLEHDVSLGNTVGRIREPKIYITYEIDPQKADVRQPFKLYAQGREHSHMAIPCIWNRGRNDGWNDGRNVAP